MITRKILVLLLTVASATACAQQQGNRRPMPQMQQMPQTQQMQQLQGRMQSMQTQMARIHETEDPAERQRLLQEHMQNMHQGMMMMGQMMQGGMMGNSTAQCQDGDTQCQLNQMQMRQQMMGRQMGMMQQMMTQMMEQMMQTEPAENSDSASHEEHH